MHIKITLPDITIEILDAPIVESSEFNIFIDSLLKLIKETEPKNSL